MNCSICGSKCEEKYKSKILDKYDVSYYLCNSCGFHFTEKPYWLNESYENIINKKDFGIMSRNIRNMKYIFSYLFLLKEFGNNHIEKKYRISENVRIAWIRFNYMMDFVCLKYIDIDLF